MSWSLWQKKICSLYNACLLNTQQFVGKNNFIPQCSEPNGCDTFVILRVLNSSISANSHQSPPKTGKPAKILRQGPKFVYEELWRCYYRDPVIWCMYCHSPDRNSNLVLLQFWVVCRPFVVVISFRLCGCFKAMSVLH